MSSTTTEFAESLAMLTGSPLLLFYRFEAAQAISSAIVAYAYE